MHLLSVVLLAGVALCIESIKCRAGPGDTLLAANRAKANPNQVTVARFKDYGLEPWQFRFDKLVQVFQVYILQDDNQEDASNRLKHFCLAPLHSGEQYDDRIQELFKDKRSVSTVLRNEFRMDNAHVLSVEHDTCFDHLKRPLVFTPQLTFKDGTVVEFPSITALWPCKYGGKLGWGAYYRRQR